MRANDWPSIDIQCFDGGLFIHMTEIKYEIEICHSGKKLAAVLGQRAGFLPSTGVACADPGGSDQTHTEFIPFFQFGWMANAFCAFHEHHHANAGRR